MESKEKGWLVGLMAIVLTFILTINFFLNPETPIKDEPWLNMPVKPVHEDHKALMPGPYETGQQVTAACLECHNNAAEKVIHSAHWKWASEPVTLPDREEPVTLTKKNTLNNFCVGIQGGLSSCTACHNGYGWEDDSFDLTDTANVDCLACHEGTGTYKKGDKGIPVEGTDLALVAQSVAAPGNENCAGCHYRGGGGIAVKHGNVDESLFFASENSDVHINRHDFRCIDCHRVNVMALNVTQRNRNDCTDCHNNKLHQDDRLNMHTDSVACQTCHIPVVEPTKSYWNWSEPSDEEPKIKGSFSYEKNRIPEYRWYNGNSNRHVLGDELDPKKPIYIQLPLGDIRDPGAKIWPFTIHFAQQPFDSFMSILVPPKMVGEGEFDWTKALELGAEMAELEFSGEYEFVQTQMFWPVTHQLAPKEQALQCQACHAENARMDWEALGYPGDPIRWGTQERNFVLKNNKRGTE